MDEAFSALDPLIRSEMQDELLRLHRAFQKTILFITHDFQEALKLGTRVAIMADGMVVREGAPQDIVTNPANDYVAAFTRDVDRARLFDASSVMVESSPLKLGGGAAAKAPSGNDEPIFVVDDSMRVLGVVGPQQAKALTGGSSIQSLMTKNYETVCDTTKLANVASLYSRDRPIAVVDEDGRFMGRVDPLQVLSRIGAPAPTPSQSRGADA
jgi:glycine betaine/proline transport system ATP-binding protein